MNSLIRGYFQRTFASLSLYNYRLYFIGQIISSSGTWMQTVALGWLVIELTGSGTQLGLVIALQYLPLLIGGAWGGVIVDRFPKRFIVTLSHSAMGVLALGIGLLVYLGVVEMWMVYIFATLYGFARIFDDSARHSLVYEMVGSEYLKNAVSLNAIVNNASRAVGPMIAGALIAGVGLEFCFMINGLSFLVVIYMLRRMRESELQSVTPTEKKPGQLQEGLRYVWANPTMRRTLILMAVIGTFTYEFHVSLPLLAEGTFAGTASSYALLLSSMGFGAVLGGLVAASRNIVTTAQLVITAVSFGFVIILTSIMPSLTLAAAGMFVVGFLSIQVTSLANTILQLESVPEMRGRVMALWTVAMLGSTPIGGPIIGMIGEYIGPRWSLAAGGAVAVIAGAIIGIRLMRNTRVETVPASVESEAAAQTSRIA